MAKFNDMTKELEEIKLKTSQLHRSMHIECDHNHQGNVIPLNKYEGTIRNIEDYSDTTVIHPACGAIFETMAFTPKEVEAAFFRIESMCHQIKLLTGNNIDDAKKGEIVKCMEMLDSIHNTIGPYYNSMVKALAKGDQKQQKRQERNIGGIGITANMLR